MQQLLTESQAYEQYRLLLEGYMADNSLFDKAAGIRSRIDTVLRMTYIVMYPDKEAGITSIPQIRLINDLFSESGHSTLWLRMNKARMTLNTKAMHRFNLELSDERNEEDLTWDDYRDCLSTICDFIAVVSGIPIPPPLLHACEKLKPRHLKDYSRLEVVFLIQLFSDISQIPEGSSILSQLRKMIGERERIGLNTLSVKVVTYAPALTLMDFPAVGSESVVSAPSGIDKALSIALDLIDAAIERKDDLGGDKPWLMWMAQDVADKPCGELVNRLQQMMGDKKIGFYPMALTPEARKHFADLWPDSGPKDLTPSLAGNFFNSVLLTVQAMHAE